MKTFQQSCVLLLCALSLSQNEALMQISPRRPKLPKKLFNTAPSGNKDCPPGPEAKVRVSTWNVLSSELCDPEYYSRNNPVDCVPEVRLERVKAQLEDEIEVGGVICLQVRNVDGHLLVYETLVLTWCTPFLVRM